MVGGIGWINVGVFSFSKLTRFRFIIFNIPGAVIGYYFGSKTGKVRDMKGVCVYEAFSKLPLDKRGQILSDIAKKMFKGAIANWSSGALRKYTTFILEIFTTFPLAGNYFYWAWHPNGISNTQKDCQNLDSVWPIHQLWHVPARVRFLISDRLINKFVSYKMPPVYKRSST